MKSCNKCLTVETADTISFDTAGTCSVCKQVEKKFDGTVDWDERLNALTELAASSRARNDRYDVIVPFSGGKDSTFQLLYVIKNLGLKPLVVRFNHWGMRPTVEHNNLRTFRELGCDVVDFRPNWKVVRELMLEALRRRGDSCWFCHTGVYSYPMHVALQYRIPLIMWGETLSEYQSFGLGLDEQVDEVRFNRAMNQGLTADDMYESLQGRVARRDLWPFAYPPKSDLDALGVRSICLGSYIPWNTVAQVERIKMELGWEPEMVEGVPGPTYEKIECFMQGTRDFSKYLKRGYGRTNHLANIAIRHGHLTREGGDLLQKEFDGKRPQSLDRYLELLGITEDEFMEIMRTHEVDPWTSDGIKFETGPALPDINDWR